jgi:hypothetical protein
VVVKSRFELNILGALFPGLAGELGRWIYTQRSRHRTTISVTHTHFWLFIGGRHRRNSFGNIFCLRLGAHRRQKKAGTNKYYFTIVKLHAAILLFKKKSYRCHHRKKSVCAHVFVTVNSKYACACLERLDSNALQYPHCY